MTYDQIRPMPGFMLRGLSVYKRMPSLTCLLLLGIIQLLGCQDKVPSKIQDDQKLFQDGVGYYEKEKYILAVDHFKEIKTRFPESPFQKQAHLRLADSYYHLKQFIDAEIEYFEFANLYPLHEDIAYVWYQKGMAQYRQAPKSAQKNLAPLMASKSTFNRVRNKWPDSEQAKQAAKMVEKCAAKEVEKELYLANFYYRTKRYPQAILKMEMLSLEGNNNPAWVGKRNMLMAKSYVKINKPAEAKRLFEAVLASDDLKAFHAESKRRLKQVK